jgi:predicted kinase
MKQVIIMQGLSGSGKTHWANTNFPNATVCSADRFFEMGDEYHFKPSLLGEAHAQCLNKYLYALYRGDSTVIVDNTNTQRWEWINYAHIAVKWGYEWAVADIYDSPAALTDEQLAARCKHNVPVEAIARQRERYEHADPSELITSEMRPQSLEVIDGWINT